MNTQGKGSRTGKGELQCPVCGNGLETRDRHGVAAAECPQGHGLWVEPQALDRMIAQGAGDTAAAPKLAPDYRLPESAVDHGYSNADIRPDANRRGG